MAFFHSDRKKKGAALIWVIAIIGLGLAALMFIIFNQIYNVNLEPIADKWINTTSVRNNITYMTFLWQALPWALVFFFLMFIISQGQKRFGDV